VGRFSRLWFALVSFGWLGLILFLFLKRHKKQQQSTTSYKKSTTKTTKATTHTTINRWGVSLAFGSLLFLLVDLVWFCFCSWSVTKNNINQQQATRNQQQKQQKQQKQQHTQQSNGWGVSLAFGSLLFLLVDWVWFCFCSWSVTKNSNNQQQATRNQQQKQQKQQHTQQSNGWGVLLPLVRSWFNYIHLYFNSII
jgi:Trk-type K+ transport system membrane component